MNTNPKPLFLFSLPRSGSTLVQRLLAAHHDIATATEPWILLPYLYTLKNKGIYAEYSHWRLREAIEDFCLEFPNGKNDYLDEIKEFILNLYAKATKNKEKYFLDKTPRYHLIIEEIINLFPDGKFIILWRNPLAVIASLIETFGRGYWNLYDYQVDLFDGLENLIANYQKYPDRIHAVRYEDIVANPEQECQRMFANLNLSFNAEIVENLDRVQLKGIYGDRTGVKQYQSVSDRSLEKWKSILNNPIRKAWCRQYLQWIGNERLALMGYKMEQLMEQLNTAPLSMENVPSDLKKIIFDRLNASMEYNTFQSRVKTVKKSQSWWKLEAPYS
jgi:hypothetical protein